MGGFLVTPFLFIGGLIAIASPVIIHLLNRRRFKRVDWAAMDFLLEAQRLNRRRVKLEEFILLLMRCLAMALIGLLLARPFMDANPSSLFGSGQTERVIILDDSLSMGARAGGESPMEEASAMLQKWVEALANDSDDDLITLVRTTDPERSAPNGLPLTEASMGELLSSFEGLEPTDSNGDLGAALLHIERSFKGDKASLNRVVYVLTDLRKRDWEGSAKAGTDLGVAATLERISKLAAGCYVIDLGGEGEENLVIEEIVPMDKALIAGVPAEFEVTVRNRGPRDVYNVKLRFSAGENLPVEAEIPEIAANGTGVAAFTYTFTAEEESMNTEPEPVPVEVSLAEDPAAMGDLLAADNVRHFPARIVKGLRVLVVDGDPSGTYGQSETFYLRNALAPRGPAASGVEVDVVDDSAFDEVELSRYGVIVVANLYRVTDERAAALEKWVDAGGGLIFLLGDQTDEDVYNEVLYKEGAGLLPVRLLAIEGDEKEESWALLNPEISNHPLFRFFEGDGRQLLDGVKVFRWWRTEFPKADPLVENGDAEPAVDPEASEPDAEEGAEAGEDSSGVRLLATLTDEGKAPVVIEHSFGEGRVLVWNTPLDNDWSNFPENGATFLITCQEMIRYMAPSRADEGVIAVSEPIQQVVDLREFRPEVEVIAPGAAAPLAAEARLPEGANEDSPLWALDFDGTSKSGVYRLKLTPADGSEQRSVLFAANIDTGESDLTRASESAIRSDLGDAQVEFVARGRPVIELGAASSRSEVWKLVLYVLAGLLVAELLFGRWIGSRR